jgi:dienelactone hydrolase
MIEETVEIGMSAATADGIFYRPKRDGRWPGVIYYTGHRRPSCFF